MIIENNACELEWTGYSSMWSMTSCISVQAILIVKFVREHLEMEAVQFIKII
jgi:hypothetical protein